MEETGINSKQLGIEFFENEIHITTPVINIQNMLLEDNKRNPIDCLEIAGKHLVNLCKSTIIISEYARRMFVEMCNPSKALNRHNNEMYATKFKQKFSNFPVSNLYKTRFLHQVVYPPDRAAHIEDLCEKLVRTICSYLTTIKSVGHIPQPPLVTSTVKVPPDSRNTTKSNLDGIRKPPKIVTVIRKEEYYVPKFIGTTKFNFDDINELFKTDSSTLMSRNAANFERRHHTSRLPVVISTVKFLPNSTDIMWSNLEAVRKPPQIATNHKKDNSNVPKCINSTRFNFHEINKPSQDGQGYHIPRLSEETSAVDVLPNSAAMKWSNLEAIRKPPQIATTHKKDIDNLPKCINSTRLNMVEISKPTLNEPSPLRSQITANSEKGFANSILQTTEKSNYPEHPLAKENSPSKVTDILWSSLEIIRKPIQIPPPPEEKTSTVNGTNFVNVTS